jgi:Zn-dependent metalloprotease
VSRSRTLALLVLTATAFGVAAQPAAAATSWHVVRDMRSATGRHVWSQQVIDGLPVYGGFVYRNVGATPQVATVHALRTPVTALRGGYRITAYRGRAIALEQSGAPIGSSATARRAAYPRGATAVRAWVVRVEYAYGPGEYDVVVDGATGAVLHSRNLVQFATGEGQVFSPNPVVTLGTSHLKDMNDSDDAVPQAAYRIVKLRDLDGSGYLRGTWVNATKGNHTASLAFQPGLTFDYLRHDDRFEAVMAYYWLDAAQRYIHTLGFGSSLPAVNAESQKIKVDAYAGDNSFYSPATDAITYGIGGVDDAEDADVILHEYGHAMQDAQVPGFGATEQGGAMGEGFGDYWAGDQTAAVTNSFPGSDIDCLADWDSISYSPPPVCLRRLDSTKHWPEDRDGEVHDDGEMWSASLWQIRGAVGRTVADRDILEAHFSLNPKSKFADGANAVIAADQALYGGVHVTAIRQMFHARGFI